jgi:hypothetical protein
MLTGSWPSIPLNADDCNSRMTGSRLRGNGALAYWRLQRFGRCNLALYCSNLIFAVLIMLAYLA